MLMKPEPSHINLEPFGFRHGHGSTHTARTMMLNEIKSLFEFVPSSALSRDDFVKAIEEKNCLGKRSYRTRLLTRRHLEELYALRPDTAIFRVLRYLWERDPDGRPLIAALCAHARDPILRETTPFVLKLNPGEAFSRPELEEYLERKYPGRFSRATLTSTARNIASSWTQSGHLTGRVKKSRSRASATPGSVAYALFLGYLSSGRGEALFKTDYAKLLDCPLERAVELAETASRKGWIVFKRVGSVIEVLFPSLLTKQESEWIREQG